MSGRKIFHLSESDSSSDSEEKTRQQSKKLKPQQGR